MRTVAEWEERIGVSEEQKHIQELTDQVLDLGQCVECGELDHQDGVRVHNQFRCLGCISEELSEAPFEELSEKLFKGLSEALFRELFREIFKGPSEKLSEELSEEAWEKTVFGSAEGIKKAFEQAMGEVEAIVAEHLKQLFEAFKK